jgi:hypothetical protein
MFSPMVASVGAEESALAHKAIGLQHGSFCKSEQWVSLGEMMIILSTYNLEFFFDMCCINQADQTKQFHDNHMLC